MNYLELGLKRMPNRYSSTLAAIYPGRNPSEHAVLNLDAKEIEQARADKGGLSLPEIYFPAWMTAILRHGQGPNAAMLTLHFSPAGSHRHADNLAIYYMAERKPILGDHGYLCDTPMNSWFRDTFSHNLVVVDGKQQNFRSPKRIPRFHIMATTPRVSVVEASSKVYDQCTGYRRLVALIKGPGADAFVVDIFRVKGGKRHVYRIFSELAASDSTDGALEFERLTFPTGKPLP